MSIDAILANKLRSVLTTLGVVIGTAILIIVLSVGAAIRFLILDQIATVTPESIYVEVQAPVQGSRSERSFQDDNNAIGRVQITTLTLKDVDDLRKLPNISAGYAMHFTQGTLSAKGEELTPLIHAVEASYPEIEDAPLAEGRFFTESEDKSLDQVMVIGSKVKSKLFGSGDSVGQRVNLNGKSYKVVGAMQEVGTKFFMDMDSIIFLPIRTVQKKELGISHVTSVALKMKDKTLIAKTSEQIKTILRRNHHIQDPSKDDFAVRTMDEAMGIVNGITGGISALLFGLAFISMVVGGVGIMNVMYVAVTERTQEIGLKKALGAKPSAIRGQFLLEAILITVIGGILGAVAGVGFSALVSLAAKLAGFDWPFVFSLPTIALAVTVSTLIGLGFGYAPALKASKLNPIEALRS